MQQIRTVLLIDDDTVTNILHRRIIERSKRVASVQVATDGQHALELLEQCIDDGIDPPELIFLDINMPRMNGFEFLEEYAARGMGKAGEKIIVMLSTSLLASDHERAAADPNVHCFENKLIKPDTFVNLVDEFFHSKNPTEARLN